MKNIVLALAACGTIALAGCTTDQGMLGGAAAGGTIGAVTTHSLGGALVGAGIGAVAGYVLVSHDYDGRCTYRYHHRLYHDRCR
jgi:hypothetical protein